VSIRRAHLLLALAAPLLIGADKPVLVPDISARQVQIRYSFTGAQLLLFGAIIYPGGRAPISTADIVVVLRGPVQPILVREKQKIAAIWMNADSNRFRSAPSFYAVASSRPISQLVDERTAAIYEMGLQNLQLSPGGGALPDKDRRFEAGLLDLRRRQGLYSENARGVETPGAIVSVAALRPARKPPASGLQPRTGSWVATYQARAAEPSGIARDYPWLGDDWFVDIHDGPSYLYT